MSSALRRDYRYSQRLGRRLGRAEEREVGRYFRHVKHRDPAHARRNLLEHFQPFAAECGLEIVEAGHIAAWVRETRDVAAAYGIGHPREDDRDRARRFHHRRKDWVGGDENQIG